MAVESTRVSVLSDGALNMRLAGLSVFSFVCLLAFATETRCESGQVATLREVLPELLA